MNIKKMTFSTFNELTKLSFSFFGLPMVLAGALLPFALKEPRAFQIAFFIKFLWIVPAFFTARISGMAFNQWLDKDFDALNPRTSQRAIPAGRATSSQAAVIAWGFLALFLVICFQVSFWGPLFGIAASLLISLYSLTKRWTLLCHFFLGMIHFLAPVMAGVALLEVPIMSSIYLGLFAGLHITASEILYAMQDTDFDRKMRLKSIPAYFGEKKALWIAQLTHSVALCMACLLANHLRIPIQWNIIPFAIGVVYFLSYHKISKGETIMKAFVFCNFFVPILMFIQIFGAVLWNVML